MSSKQDTGKQRDIIDKFYTKKNVVKLCIDEFKKNIIIDKNDIIIEPSAGNGSFIPYIKKIIKNYKFYDIQPENQKEIIKQNFLDLDMKDLNANYNNIHIIGNPPFGKQSSLAKKFIEHSAKYSNTISFILPKSFKKPSMYNAFPLNFHILKEIDLPENSFLVNDNEYDVPCVFQIWIKKDFEREKPVVVNPNNFEYVSKANDNYNICVRRVGINAGNVFEKKDCKNKSTQSHYFIKIKNYKKSMVHKLNNIKYPFNNTVGPKSISKQELNEIYNKNI